MMDVKGPQSGQYMKMNTAAIMKGRDTIQISNILSANLLSVFVQKNWVISGHTSHTSIYALPTGQMCKHVIGAPHCSSAFSSVLTILLTPSNTTGWRN